MHWNAILVPGNLSLEHSGCEIIGFYSQNPRSWAQQVILIRYVNESFKFHVFTIINSQCRMLLQQNWKKKQHNVVLNIHSIDHW